MQLFAFLVPIVGLGAFLWWAGRDMVQDSVRLLQFCFLFIKAHYSFCNWNTVSVLALTTQRLLPSALISILITSSTSLTPT